MPTVPIGRRRATKYFGPLQAAENEILAMGYIQSGEVVGCLPKC